MLRIPWLCPESVASGMLVEDLKSHNLITGLRSLVKAVNKWKPCVGFQAMSEIA